MSQDLNHAIPSKDPAAADDPGGTMVAIFKKLMQGVDGQLPAVVMEYDRQANTALVRPLVTLLTTEMKPVSRGSVASVPVLALGGGGYVVNFPLKPGDVGWIEASDRDISLFMQGGQSEAQPNTLRLHTFKDGRFVPDVFGKYTIAGENAEAMVIQTLDGSECISIAPGKIKIKGTALLEVDVPQTNWTGILKLNGVTMNTHKHDLPGGAQTIGDPHN